MCLHYTAATVDAFYMHVQNMHTDDITLTCWSFAVTLIMTATFLTT